MVPFPATITDPVFKEKDWSATDRFFLKYIKDKRDLPFIYLSIRITLIMLPIGLAMYIPGLNNWVWWGLAIAYFYVNNFVFKGPFGLMLHCTSHRPWFKKEHKWANYYLPWIVGPFFGQSPETYFSHHIGMHHLENNLEDDESTTMHYQRDNIGDFFKYYLNFMFIGLYTLVKYFTDRNRPKFAKMVIRGEFTFILFCVALSFVNFWATFMVFILPFIVSRLIMMMGNFAQHTFVDVNDPGNSYKNSISCINVKYNHKCWNDGYHISHHVKAAMHWTDHPHHLRDNIDTYAENKSLVFEGIDFLQVWWYVLVKKDYKKLAKHIVNLNNMFASEEEAIELMKARTKKIPRGTGPKTPSEAKKRLTMEMVP